MEWINVNIIVAPDAFKGSASAKNLCRSMSKGIKRVLPHAVVKEFPLADGGEGTMENLIFATKGTIQKVEVLDPLGRPIQAGYGVLGDGKTVIIEMAQASGLPLLSESEKNPMEATSFGTGQLISAALDKGYRDFVIGLGGSATNDGGIGMIKALGVELYDDEGNIIMGNNVEYLKRLSSFNMKKIDSRIKESKFIIASDVDNPLCGSRGASVIFGPQKGATSEMVETLDKSLYNYGKVITNQFFIDILNIPGAGAAGGMGAALITFLNATIRSGIELTLEFVNIEQEMEIADLVITGEGKLDEQTLSGKVIAGVCKVAKEKKVPVLAICGSNELTAKEMDEIGLLAAYPIVPGPCTLQQAIEQAEGWTENCVEQIVRGKYL